MLKSKHFDQSDSFREPSMLLDCYDGFVRLGHQSRTADFLSDVV